MRFRNMPGVRHIRNARVRGDMMREETPEAIAAAQAGMNVYWDDYERAHFTLTDLEKAED